MVPTSNFYGNETSFTIRDQVTEGEIAEDACTTQ